MNKHRIPIILLPFKIIWDLFEFILKITGRLAAMIIGLAIMIVGIVLCLTVLGAVIGIPFIIFGFMMMIRGFF